MSLPVVVDVDAGAGVEVLAGADLSPPLSAGVVDADSLAASGLESALDPDLASDFASAFDSAAALDEAADSPSPDLRA